ncbi:MAG: hypothetical protein Q9228_002888 [Teloschistes exilis]
MSAATQKPVGDLSQTGPTFSYAQAAKGRSPSGPSSISMETGSKEDAAAGTSKVSASDKSEGPPASDIRSAKRAASEGRQPRHDKESLGDTKPLPRHTPDLGATPAATTPATQASAQSHVVLSTPSSPEFGVTSASTLPKDDDMFSNANGSSDSTWEKLSQGSQSGSRSHDKTEVQKEPVESTTWDEALPASTGLKEAPPPAVNIWTQRIEAKAAKHPPTSTSVGLSDSNGVTKSFDIGAESKKQDSKKQAKRPFRGPDEKPATTGAKAGMSTIDGWPKEEGTGTRSRRVDKVDTTDRSLSSSVVPFPPPGDSRSWPTVDSVQDEDKKKAYDRAEKGEKEKTPTAKSHKEKWVPVPYVPNVIFDTPIPLPVRRGTRPPRGGGNTVSRLGPSSSDKPRALSPDASAGSYPASNDSSKPETANPRNVSTNSRPKRASSTGPASSRDQRRGNETAGFEKHGKSFHANAPPNGSSPTEGRRTSATTHDEFTRSRGFAPSSVTREPQHSDAKDSRNHAGNRDREDGANETHAHPRSGGFERRGEGGFRSYDPAREYHKSLPPRERGEGRSERGRGGYRSRGTNNHHTLGHASLSNGHGSPHPFVPPAMPLKASPNHERNHSHAPPYGHHQSSRHQRPSSRSQSITHPSPASRYPQGPHTTSGHNLPGLHTDVNDMWGYHTANQGVMSAGPYTAYMEQASIFGMVTMQMEYYFSVDNLCKDLYLRKHMDSQGFVFLSVLAKFNRIRQLTQDLELVRYVCLHSPQIEFRTGSDGCDRLRKREGWQQWILTLEERDPSVQNEGPSQMHQPDFPPQTLYGAPYGVDERQITSPHSANHNYYHGSDISSMTYLPNSIPGPTPNGHDDQGMNVETPVVEAVPKTAPSLHAIDPMDSVPPEAYPPMQNTFSDEQVDLLMVVVRKSPNQPAHTLPPFHSANTRTFSNGSIDGRTISSELTALDGSLKQLSVNGDEASEATDQASSSSRNPMHIGSPPRQAASNTSPPVFWVKDKDTPIDSLPEGVTHEPYHVFRRNALQQRGVTSSGVCPSDLKLLYEFWSHFLVRNFNTRMYHEFRQIAFDDANNRQSAVGVEKLIQYYNESILSPKDVVSDQIASDFLSLVGNEGVSHERPAFDRLRAAWRNGAFNIQNRKKLDSIMDPSLKAAIEN